MRAECGEGKFELNHPAPPDGFKIAKRLRRLAFGGEGDQFGADMILAHATRSIADLRALCTWPLLPKLIT
jgi:hypothetical protein